MVLRVEVESCGDDGRTRSEKELTLYYSRPDPPTLLTLPLMRNNIQ